MSAPVSDAPAPEASPERGAMPTVARPRAGLSGAAITIGAAVAALLLFGVLDARRRALSAPAVRPARADLVQQSEAPPPLYIPPVPRAAIAPPVPPAQLPIAAREAPQAPPAPPSPPAAYPSAPPQAYVSPPETPPAQRNSSGPILVVDGPARV